MIVGGGVISKMSWEAVSPKVLQDVGHKIICVYVKFPLLEKRPTNLSSVVLQVADYGRDHEHGKLLIEWKGMNKNV